MNKIAHLEENWRLDMAFAAMEVAGTSDRHFLLSDAVPEDRRQYLYAVPDQEEGGDKAGVSRVSAEIEKSGVPYGVNLDRNSEHYGLRYLAGFTRMPPELRSFTDPVAREAWADWRRREREMDATVVELAGSLAQDPERDLDRALEHRVADQASRLIDRRRAPARRARSDERD